MRTVTLQATSILFLSPLDEDAFFEWLKKLRCVTEVRGELRTLNITVAQDLVNFRSMQEFFAVFTRYGIDVKQLRVLERPEFQKLFNNPNSAWFDALQ